MSNNFEELEKLHNLKEKGILTEEEYLSQKDAVLNKLKDTNYVTANNLWETYTKVWREYFKFSGRSSRYEYWGFTLINFIITLVLSALASSSIILGLFNKLYSLLIIIPSLAIIWRRLHDTNRSGWWLGSLLILTPILAIFAANLTFDKTSGFLEMFKAGALVFGGLWLVVQFVLVIIFMFFKGDAEANKYGEPVAQTPAQDKTGKIISILFLIFYLLLPVIGVISAVGILGYSKSMDNSATDEVSKLAANTQAWYAKQTNYDGLSNSSAIANGLVPQNMQDGENIKNSFGGNVYIFGRGTLFMVEFTNVPKDKCEAFMAKDWKNGLQTIMFDDDITSCKECPEEGCPMIWVFN